MNLVHRAASTNVTNISSRDIKLNVVWNPLNGSHEFVLLFWLGFRADKKEKKWREHWNGLTEISKSHDYSSSASEERRAEGLQVKPVEVLPLTRCLERGAGSSSVSLG
ncbi:hypothetical protein TNCV_4785991 [Trichonephila clavipes]|nr:hypothetical protein TNCV_4785991 [Trichonephila clavipes]